jgi:serine/threonine protein phosphatase PrpC
VAEQHLGVPVQCGRCGRSFTTRGETAAPPLRLDIAAASTDQGTDGFLVQHLVCINLDERRELAVLAIAGEQGVDTLSAALVPLLSNFLSGTLRDVSSAAEAVAAALPDGPDRTVLVIADGQACLAHAGDGRAHHLRGGQLVPVAANVSTRLKLAAGDWLLVAGAGLHTHLDAPAIQAEIAGSQDARQAAQKLIERIRQHGRDNCVVIAVRCY